jgi:hypothetical protein
MALICDTYKFKVCSIRKQISDEPTLRKKIRKQLLNQPIKTHTESGLNIQQAATKSHENEILLSKINHTDLNNTPI